MNRECFQNLSSIPRCFCRKDASCRLSERAGILIYDCHYVKHANPWNVGNLLEYDYKNNKIINVKYNPSYLSEKEIFEEVTQSTSTTTEEMVEFKLCKSKENSICAFHVHQPIWNELYYGKEDSQKNHPELNTCPFFNFTYCVSFKTINDFPINMPSVPRCYCSRPIVLRRIGANNYKFGRWFMSCASYQIPGARPKCTWFKWPGLVKYDSKDQCSHDDIYKFEQVSIIEARYQKWQYEKNFGTDNDLSNYTLMVKSQQYTGIPKTYIAISFVATLFSLIFFNIGGEILSNFIGWVYPACASFNAIEHSNKADSSQWLTYWVIYGALHVVEFFSDYILIWMPSYFFFKTIFLLWLSFPTTKGASYIYEKAVRPIISEYESNVDKPKKDDKQLNNWKEKLDGALESSKEE